MLLFVPDDMALQRVDAAGHSFGPFLRSSRTGLFHAETLNRIAWAPEEHLAGPLVLNSLTAPPDRAIARSDLRPSRRSHVSTAHRDGYPSGKTPTPGMRERGMG
jgi:hypothetical protein